MATGQHVVVYVLEATLKTLCCRFCDEVEQKRVLYKGTFGTLIPGGPGKNFLQISPRNVANTGLLTSRGRCYALFEAGQPHSLDPQTLETIGLDSLGGTVPIGAPFSTFSSFLDSVLGIPVSGILPLQFSASLIRVHSSSKLRHTIAVTYKHAHTNCGCRHVRHDRRSQGAEQKESTLSCRFSYRFVQALFQPSSW